MVGQTMENFQNRLKSHKCGKTRTALNKHEDQQKYKFNFNNTTILKREAHKKRREICEMIAINKFKIL